MPVSQAEVIDKLLKVVKKFVRIVCTDMATGYYELKQLIT
jgi:hypothetical protein